MMRMHPDRIAEGAPFQNAFQELRRLLLGEPRQERRELFERMRFTSVDHCHSPAEMALGDGRKAMHRGDGRSSGVGWNDNK